MQWRILILIGHRLHGTENLLHRACAMADVTVVSELLAVGYRQEGIFCL